MTSRGGAWSAGALFLIGAVSAALGVRWSESPKVGREETFTRLERRFHDPLRLVVEPEHVTELVHYHRQQVHPAKSRA